MMVRFLVLVSLILGNTIDRSVAEARPHRPLPLRCSGSETLARGHALVITPSLHRTLTSAEKNQIKYLAGENTKDIPLDWGSKTETQVLNLKIDPTVIKSSYKSLSHYITSKKFLGPVTFTLLPTQSKVNLEELKDEIKGSWKKMGAPGPETLFVELELGTATVIAGIQYHDSAQDCLPNSDAPTSQGTTSPTPAASHEDLIKTVIQVPPAFVLPVKQPFIVSYFFGPRIFRSMNESISMESQTESGTDLTKPISVAHKLKNPISFLNKYWNFHSGIDFSVPKNTPLYSPYEGTVFASGPMGCAGRTLVVEHTLNPGGQVVYSVFEHLQSAGKLVPTKHGNKFKPWKLGDHVDRGQLVAKSGKSGDRIRFVRGYKDGCVKGAHLHYEIRTARGEKKQAPPAASTPLRFYYLQTQTVSVNPADFISEVDGACQARKDVELKNALLLAEHDPGAIPPITAGLCSVSYERSLKNQPKLYQLTRQKEDTFDELGNTARVNEPSEPSSKPL